MLGALSGRSHCGRLGARPCRLQRVEVGRPHRRPAVGEIRLERIQRFFRDLQGQSFTYDGLADRLDEMAARGAILDWAIRPERSAEGVDLQEEVALALSGFLVLMQKRLLQQA